MIEKEEGAPRVTTAPQRKERSRSSVAAGLPAVKKRKRELTHREHERFCAIQVIVEFETLKGHVSSEFEKGVKAFSHLMWTIKSEPLEELQERARRLRGPSSPRALAILERVTQRRPR